MTEGTIRNIIASEFRVVQQRINERMLTRADLSSAIDKINTGGGVTKQDISVLKAALDDIRFEQKSQRQILNRQSAYIEALDRDARTHSNQLGSLWRFVQQ